MLSLVSQAGGGGASVQTSATISAINTAIAEAQLSLEELVSGNTNVLNEIGANLNVLA